MFLSVLKAKIQPATVTDANLYYEGSITIDQELLEASGMLPFEKVDVLNINNGFRAQTYIIRGERGSGSIIMNGALARHAEKGDKVIILCYGMIEESRAVHTTPNIILVDEENRIKSE